MNYKIIIIKFSIAKPYYNYLLKRGVSVPINKELLKELKEINILL
jgi:hypothetical protein